MGPCVGEQAIKPMQRVGVGWAGLLDVTAVGPQPATMSATRMTRRKRTCPLRRSLPLGQRQSGAQRDERHSERAAQAN
jgi:hypothetical protein